MPNEKLKNIAVKILSKTNIPKEDNYGFAIITVLMIISIVLTCVRILQECNKDKADEYCTAQKKCQLYGEQIRSYSIRKGWFTKMRIKKILRKEMSKEDYNKYSIPILSALLDTGEFLTDDEVATLVEAANV
jgi:hypothetical protein